MAFNGWLTRDWTQGELNAVVKNLGEENAIRVKDGEKFELVFPADKTSVGSAPTILVRKPNKHAILWRAFYEHDFPELVAKYPADFDFSKVEIPSAPREYGVIQFMPKRGILGDEMMLTGGVVPYKISYRWTSNMDTAIDHDFGRDRLDSAYVVRYRFGVEADEDMKNMSAREIAEKGINTLTFRERADAGRFWMWHKNIILDRKTITLCAGSRYSAGVVPYLLCRVDGVYVHWCYLGRANDDLRARRAVSVS
jgi:hypothetical protein